MIAASAVMLTKNSERYLAQVLAALADFDEVLLLDNGSEDATIEIAAGFANVRIETSPFIGFGPLKNLAAEKAKHDWIFSIDSDELPSRQLLDSIAQAVSEHAPRTVYKLLRENHYRGRHIKACGWHPDWLPRLYRKSEIAFSDRQVHESLQIPADCRVLPLAGTLKHYSFDGATGLIAKMQQYSSLFATENRGKKPSSLGKAITHAISAFIKNYLLKKGIAYGADGFVISAANAQGAYYKYIKLMEANQAIPVSLIITTYNRPDALKAVIESAFAQTVLPKEILIADDGSGAAAKDIIESLQTQSPVPLIHVWHEDRGFRLAEIRNRAIARAAGDYIVMIDGDMALHPKFIEDHLQAARLGSIVQGSRVLLTESATHELLKTGAQPDFTPFSKGIEKRHAAIRLPCLSKKIAGKTSQKFKGIKGCNLGFFRQDALSINGFNNRFVGWGREDSEFFARAFHNGFHRRNLKFAGLAYHLYHQENDRASLPENDALLQKTLDEKLTACEDGVNRYLENPDAP